MSLRIFADHCIPNSVTATLRTQGHDVRRLRDYLPQDAPDPRVIEQAQADDCILLSLNGDFADIVTYPPRLYRGILSLQLHNHPEILPDLTRCLTAYLDAHEDMGHYRGRLFIVEVHRIRMRG
jgi:predicted nuclease of predicted toxin-antitoxin system